MAAQLKLEQYGVWCRNNSDMQSLLQEGHLMRGGKPDTADQAVFSYKLMPDETCKMQSQ